MREAALMGRVVVVGSSNTDFVVEGARIARGVELIEAVRFAAAAASLSVEKRGAQASCPARRRILSRLGRGR